MAINDDLFRRHRARLRKKDFSSIAGDDPNVGTTGSAVWDFLGQAAWGFSSGVTLDALSAHDTYLEATDPSEKTWEETIAGGAAGDWDQLSGAGKAGNIVGQALGMIPSFFYGGAVTKGGTMALSGVAKKGLSTSIGTVSYTHLTLSTTPYV